MKGIKTKRCSSLSETAAVIVVLLQSQWGCCSLSGAAAVFSDAAAVLVRLMQSLVRPAAVLVRLLQSLVGPAAVLVRRMQSLGKTLSKRRIDRTPSVR